MVRSLNAAGSDMVAQATTNNLTLVLGGAASGKSLFAEKLVVQTGRDRVYLATSQAFDDEMRAKIARHIAQRGPDWTTIEQPIDVAAALACVTDTQAVLLDCATLWLTNVMLAEMDIEVETRKLLSAVADCRVPVVIVSNEIGLGLVPDNALSRQFREAQGLLNQRIAEIATTVVFVAAGLPMVLKGQL